MLPELDLLTFFKAATAYVIVLLAAKFTLNMFGEQIKDLFNYVGNEIRATLRMKPALKALNAYGMTFLFLAVVFAGYIGHYTMPRPTEGATHFQIVLLENGARAFYVLVFLIGFLFCVLLTKHER
jgi:hypothetical protein